MGIPLQVFTLHAYEGAEAGCRHHLLLRVAQPGFSNADEAEHEAAVRAADAARGALLRAYERGVLASECPGAHEVRLVGELQSLPVGDVLVDGRGGMLVELWVAETRYGAPWVVMGTATDEDAFWREVDEEGDLASLGPIRPARRHRAYFLAEDD